MSEISKLFGKGKKIKIGEKGSQVELELKPLGISDMDIMMDMADEKKRTGATKRLITKIFKDSIPDATIEEIEKVSLKYMPQIMEALSDVLGIDIDENKAKFLEEVKKKQSGQSV